MQYCPVFLLKYKKKFQQITTYFPLGSSEFLKRGERLHILLKYYLNIFCIKDARELKKNGKMVT